jgi:hypothetical protein
VLNPAVQAAFQDNPARPFCSIESLHSKTLCNNNKRKIYLRINWLRENIEKYRQTQEDHNRGREEWEEEEKEGERAAS